MRTKGTAAELDARRRLAVERVQAGWKRTDVAAFLGMHPETVGAWVRGHAASGNEALAAKPHPGRQPFLTADQEKQVLGWLAEVPTTHGFPTDLWTAKRVADLIQKAFGVEFHPGYLRECGVPGWPPRRVPEGPLGTRRFHVRGVGRWGFDELLAFWLSRAVSSATWAVSAATWVVSAAIVASSARIYANTAGGRSFGRSRG